MAVLKHSTLSPPSLLSSPSRPAIATTVSLDCLKITGRVQPLFTICRYRALPLMTRAEAMSVHPASC